MICVAARRPTPFAIWFTFFCCAAAQTASAVQATTPRGFSWTPRRPVEGSGVLLTGGAVRDVTGIRPILSVEPVHWTRWNDHWQAFLPVALDATEVRYRAERTWRDGHADTIDVVVPVTQRPRTAPARLSVRPSFGSAFDSATAERIAREEGEVRQFSARAHETPILWSLPFVRPRPGRTTASFGQRRVFNGRVVSTHSGLDLAGAVGSPVRAIARGVVRVAESHVLGGQSLYVDHGGGLLSGYMHLSKYLASPGDTVGAGQIIGRVGTTGRVTGPHLHLAIRYGNLLLDPARILPLMGAPAHRDVARKKSPPTRRPGSAPGLRKRR